MTLAQSSFGPANSDRPAGNWLRLRRSRLREAEAARADL